MEFLIPIAILLALLCIWRYVETRRRKSTKRREFDEPDIPEDPWRGFDRNKGREEPRRSSDDGPDLDIDISD